MECAESLSSKAHETNSESAVMSCRSDLEVDNNDSMEQRLEKISKLKPIFGTVLM